MHALGSHPNIGRARLLRHAVLAFAVTAVSASLAVSQTLYAPGGTVGTSSNSNVGIGTSSPGHELDVIGTVNATDFRGTIGATTPGTGAFTTLDVNGATLGSYAAAMKGGNLILSLQSTAASSILQFAGSTGDVWRVLAGIDVAGDFGIYNETDSRTDFKITEAGAITMPGGGGLSVTGTLSATGTMTLTGAGGGSIQLRNTDDTNGATITNIGSSSTSSLRFNLGGVTYALLNPNSLSVTGTLSATGTATFASNFKVQPSGSGSDIVNPSGTDGLLSIYGGSSFNNGAGIGLAGSTHSTLANTIVFTNGAYVERMRVDSNGNVGIGTSSPSHKLAVNGTIKSKEVIVETTGWADYVLKPEYRLPPLSEIQAHIDTHGTLPGMPSEAEVAGRGISLGEMQAKLLAKIEEITLHQIAQAKEIAELRAENATLRDELRSSFRN